MKFTKEYIKECDCKEIRNLEETKIGNWHSVNGEIILHFANGVQFVPVDAKIIWLPTGDQLDDEIEFICDMQKGFNYNIYSALRNKRDKYSLVVGDGMNKMIESDDNRLIAKIKLLKALLKEKK